VSIGGGGFSVTNMIAMAIPNSAMPTTLTFM